MKINYILININFIINNKIYCVVRAHIRWGAGNSGTKFHVLRVCACPMILQGDRKSDMSAQRGWGNPHRVPFVQGKTRAYL